MEPLLRNWEGKLIWRLLLPEAAFLTPEFIFMKCTKTVTPGKMYIMPIILTDFRRWRKKWFATGLSLIFCLSLRPPATVRLLTGDAAIWWTESVQSPPGICFGRIRALACKRDRETAQFLPGGCFYQIGALLSERGKESKHIFTPFLAGAAIPKTCSVTSGGKYLA